MTDGGDHGEKLDRLIPLIGIGVDAYLVGRAAARRAESELHAPNGGGYPYASPPPITHAQIAAAVAAARPKPRFGWAKKLLVLAMLLGVVSFVLGGSTFASFSAETSNPGSTFATGTLTLSNQVNSQTVCNSVDATSLDNYKATCNAILALTNEAPGVTDTSGSYIGGYAKVTIANTGSLNASTFNVYAPYVNARINTQISSGATVGAGQTVTSFTVTPLEGPVATNDKLWLSTGSTTQQFCAGAPAAGGATSITISGGYAVGASGSCPASTTTAGTTYNVGSRLNDLSTNTSAANTDCFDAQTTSASGGATFGTQLNFNSTTNNPLCSTTLLWVQEQSTYGASTYNYCWFGRGSAFGDQSPSGEDSNGQCRTPTTLVLASNVTAGSTSYSLNVGTLAGNIRSGDTITFTESGNTMTCTAASTYNIGYASTVSVNTCSGGGAQVFDGSAVVKDTSAFTGLNSTNSSSTLSYFDQHYFSGSGIAMPPLTGNGTTNATATVQLGKAGTAGSSGVAPATRVYYIGVYIPAPSNTTQNTIQGLVSTFGLTWHVDQ